MIKRLLLLVGIFTFTISNSYFALNAYAAEIIFKDVDQKHWAANEIKKIESHYARVKES